MDHLTEMRRLAGVKVAEGFYTPNIVITKELVRTFRSGLQEGESITDSALQDAEVAQLQSVIEDLLFWMQKMNRWKNDISPGFVPTQLGDNSTRLFQHLSGRLEALALLCGKVHAMSVEPDFNY